MKQTPKVGGTYNEKKGGPLKFSHLISIIKKRKKLQKFFDFLNEALKANKTENNKRCEIFHLKKLSMIKVLHSF